MGTRLTAGIFLASRAAAAAAITFRRLTSHAMADERGSLRMPDLAPPSGDLHIPLEKYGVTPSALVDILFAAAKAGISIIDRDFSVLTTNCFQSNANAVHCHDRCMNNPRPCEGCPASTVFSSSVPVKDAVVTDSGGGAWTVDMYPLSGATGETVLAAVLYQPRTTTETDRYERDIIDFFAAVGELSPVFAHDLNNHFTAIQGYTDIIRMSMEPSNRFTEEFREITQAIKASTTITDGLLELTERSFGRPYPGDIHRDIEFAVTLRSRQFEKHSLRIARNYQTGIPQVTCRHVAIRAAAFIHIIQYMLISLPHGGILSIATALEILQGVPHVKITFTGIPPEHAPDTMTQPGASNPAENRHLSFARRAIASHNGLMATPPSPGAAVTVSMYLPVTSA